MYMENQNSGFYRKVWTYLRWIYYYLQGKESQCILELIYHPAKFGCSNPYRTEDIKPGSYH